MSWWYENEEEEMNNEIVNDKNLDRIKDSIPVPKVEPVNCKDCDDTVCCERGKDKWAYCPRCFEKKESKMEFDKSRVFTALNADELKRGDKVITARCMADLKTWVEADAEPNVIELIQDETNTNRFTCKCFGSNKTYDTSLAYLVERKENCLKCKKCEVISDKSMHCDWVGTGPITSARVEKCNHYEPKTGKKEMCLNCKHYNKVNDFRDCTIINNPTGACPHYEAEKKYRPFKDVYELIKVWDEKLNQEQYWDKDRALMMPYIWVQSKLRPKHKALITEYDMCFQHIRVDISWDDLEGLFNSFTFLDGTPCGVEE